MKIYDVKDPEFAEYGRVVEGIDVSPILKVMNEKLPCPESGTQYVAEEPLLQGLPEADAISLSLFGGIPAQFGWCNGHNTKLNCFEYHRNSEYNLGTEDFILLLAKESEIHDFKIDSSVTKAFKIPAGVLVEVYATSLHYAPCQASKDKGFKTLVVLPRGTNVGVPEAKSGSTEDPLLRMTNKWLIAHSEAKEAKDGAFVGITGPNIDIADSI